MWSGWSDTREFIIDTQSPYNAIATSPDTAGSIFLVRWSAGNDPDPSSGIVAYDIYKKDSESQNWAIWLSYFQEGLSAFLTSGQHGYTYYFEALAIDSAGNQETRYSISECSTYVDTSWGNVAYPYLPGDINMYNGIWPPECIGSDVTYLVGYFRGVSANQPCYLDDFWASADANGDCNIIGSDVTRLVNYFRGNVSLLYCPDYEPLWLTPDDLPDDAAAGWPNCDIPVINSKVIPTGLDK